MIRIFFSLVIVSVMLYSCSTNNVKSDSAIVKMMDSAGMQGTFAIMENSSEQFTISNLSRYKDSAYAPLNTFFILPTLVALDKGYINRAPATWVPSDSTAFYEALIAKIGRQEILKTIDSIHYGKGIVSADLNRFWSDNSLRITPDEQLGLIKKLYFNELYFQKRAQELYRKMILKEDNANYRLSYMAASDTTANNAAWVVGYIEENKHPYFFVLNTNSLKSDSLSEKNVQMVKQILLQQGFLKGLR